MAKPKTSLAGIFDEPEVAPAPAIQRKTPALRVAPMPPKGEGRASHPGKKPVLIHIPEDMHRVLRQLSVEDGGEPITRIVERSLRDYLVKRGYVKFGKS